MNERTRAVTPDEIETYRRDGVVCLRGADKVNFLFDQIFIKQPGANTRTAFHQDRGYFRRRAAVLAWYTKPIYRSQENWFLSLDPAVRQFASNDLLMLLGYKTAGLGLVNGASPA